MGMSDSQFKNHLRMVLRALKRYMESQDIQILKDLIEDLQQSLED